MNDIGELVEDFDEVGKLGNGFTSIDELEKIDIGGKDSIRPTYVNAALVIGQKAKCMNY
jgi:hypothetical protein